jgi:GT2 family glycosyltransferase
MLVSVVVLNWNGRQHLETCLSALCLQTYSEYEIILVDNGSTDGSADYVEANFPAVRVIRLPENLGFCGGNNAGITQARGDCIALLNNDTEADPVWLAESVKALEAHPDAGCIAARMRLFDRRTYLDTVGDLYFRNGCPAKRGWLMPDGPEYEQNSWVFSPCAGAAVYRRVMLEEVGLFDEDFFNNMEDLDLGFRAQLLGYRCLYVASAIVYHKVGATVGFAATNPQQLYRAHRNHWYVLIKNLPTSLWCRYLGHILVTEILILGAAAWRGRLSILVRARAEVVRTLPRMLAKRRVIQKCRKVSVVYLDSLFQKGWLSNRMAEKRRETAFISTR